MTGNLGIPVETQAGEFLETIGLSVAVGTVLGTSTLPFYAQPENQWMNIAYGASIGAAAGVGIVLSSWLAGKVESLSYEKGGEYKPRRGISPERASAWGSKWESPKTRAAEAFRGPRDLSLTFEARGRQPELIQPASLVLTQNTTRSFAPLWFPVVSIRW